jgi:phosphatidate cytidylyltransferase
MTDRNDKRSTPRRPTEGVRIIGVEEASQAFAADEADEPTGSLPVVRRDAPGEMRPGLGTVPPDAAPSGRPTRHRAPSPSSTGGVAADGAGAELRARRRTRRPLEEGATMQPATLRWAAETPADPEGGGRRASSEPPGDQAWTPDAGDARPGPWAPPVPTADRWAPPPDRRTPGTEEGEAGDALVPDPADPTVARRKGPRRQDPLSRGPGTRRRDDGAVGRPSGASAGDQETGRVASGPDRAASAVARPTVSEAEPSPAPADTVASESGLDDPALFAGPALFAEPATFAGPALFDEPATFAGPVTFAGPAAPDRLADFGDDARGGDAAADGEAAQQLDDAFAEGDETTGIHKFVTFGDNDEEDSVIDDPVLRANSGGDTAVVGSSPLGGASLDDSDVDPGATDEAALVAAPTGRAGRRPPRLRRPAPGPEEGAGPDNGATAVSGRRPGLRRGGPDDLDGNRSGQDLRSRIVVGVGMAALFVVAYAVGPKALLVLGAVVVLLCAAEAYSMLQRCGFRPATLLGLTATGGLMFAAYWRGEPAVPLVTALAFAATMIWYLLGIVEARPLANVAVTSMTILWVGLLGSFAALLLRVPHGKGLFLGAVVVTVASDIVAYFAGRRWGRHALAPTISPSKTVEGLVAGAVAALVVGIVVGESVSPWGGLAHGLLLGVAVAIFAPVGDLFESLIKRDLEVKDSGTVLAGHGGLLDRFDSVLLVLPVTYYLADYLHLLK